MEQINKIIEFFNNITKAQVIDLLISIIIIAIFIIFSTPISYFIIKLFKWKEKDKSKIKENAFYKPVKIACVMLGVIIGFEILDLPREFMNIFYLIEKIIFICIAANGLANVFAPNSILMRKVAKSNRVKENEALVKFLSKTAKYIIYTGAGILIISTLGFNLNGLIAGLGIGSVVVALAAQDFAKSLFAGITILLDKPFVVGDWIETKNYAGTVVDITFKSTRIKTAEETMVTIQNSTLSEETIVNYAKMKKRRYSFNLKLPLQVNSDTIEKILTRIRFVLKHNKDVITNNILVECNSILEDGINIFVSMYTPIVNFNEYLNFRTKVNETILNIMESEGIRLSNPSKDIYIANIEDCKTVKKSNENIVNDKT